MPIKPENRRRYPPEWPEIRDRVLRRAKYRCEWPGCGATHHAVGEWVSKPRGWTFSPIVLGDGRGDWKAGAGRLPYSEAKVVAEQFNLRRRDDGKWIVIVLTVAHLDHQPENCGMSNLAAWCQRHHLAYDQEHHAQTAYMARKARANTPDLFALEHQR